MDFQAPLSLRENPTPLTRQEARIGLLGGSFNPPHSGHRALSLAAFKALSLDQIWWLVSPANPQKRPEDYAAYEARLKASVTLAHHPRIHISDFEQHAGTQYSFHTIEALKQAWPEVHFVWLMGADNLASFHTWKNWQAIFDMLPIAVFNRPGYGAWALRSPASLAFAHRRLAGRRLRRLALQAPPAWGFIRETQNPTSSTQLRQNNPSWLTEGVLTP